MIRRFIMYVAVIAALFGGVAIAQPAYATSVPAAVVVSEEVESHVYRVTPTFENFMYFDLITGQSTLAPPGTLLTTEQIGAGRVPSWLEIGVIEGPVEDE